MVSLAIVHEGAAHAGYAILHHITPATLLVGLKRSGEQYFSIGVSLDYRLDKRIEELASGERYAEKVKKLGCFLGVKTPTALATIVESGDFKRFKKGNVYAAYIGLTPSEHSSGDSVVRGGISKAGNTHLRRLFVEAAQSICKGEIGHKSKALSARQTGNESEVIAYADKANERMRRKYYRMMAHGKTRNVAVTAIARELACFIWGMMTGDILMSA